MILVDTNIFLEILLDQEKRRECQTFLDKYSSELVISTFSLYSIGIILCRSGMAKTFDDFLSSILPIIQVVSIEPAALNQVTQAHKTMKLDFDDAYQFAVAKHSKFKLATLDKDFKKTRGEIERVFI